MSVNSYAKKIYYSTLKMGAVQQCVLSYVVNSQRCFERGNQSMDCLDYMVFHLDRVINNFVRYLSTEGIDLRVIDFLHEVKDTITSMYKLSHHESYINRNARRPMCSTPY